MKTVIVKTIDGSVFRFDNPKFFDTMMSHSVLVVMSAKNEKIIFPLNNIISISEEGNDETTKKTDVQSKEVNE